MDCFKCSISLDKRPCIFVYSKPSYAKPYCFRCAKRIEKGLVESAKQKHEQALKIYEEKSVAFKKKHPNFGANLEWGEIFSVGGIFAIICNLFIPVVGIFIGFFIGYGVRRFFWEKEQVKLDATFELYNPMPSNPEPVKFDIKFDATHFAEPITEKNYRRQTLLRDNYSCQNCEERKSEADLEVHHIHMRSKGGIDHPTNLVTLCKPCHDREKWFGHKRMYPTTF